MTKEELKAVLTDIFKVARFVAELTKRTKWDDAVVLALEGVVMQDWALELILKLLSGKVTDKQLQDCCNVLSDVG